MTETRSCDEFSAELCQERLRNFCSRLSHDLNNHIGIVQGYLELLGCELEPGTEARAYLEPIQQACRKLHQKVMHFETFAQARQFAKAPVHLGGLLQQICTSLPRVVLRSEGNPPPTWGDPKLLEAAFKEVIQNALEADPIGQVDVKVESQKHNQLVTVSNFCEFFPVTPKELIFEPYFSTKSKARGNGLAMAHGVIGSHGGQVQVSHQGSLFILSISLPYELEGETVITG